MQKTFGRAASHASVSAFYDGKIAGMYDLEETLGRGHFAVVKLARHVFTGEKVAVKVIDKTKLDEVSRAHLFQEVRCMKLVQHPNVVRLYEVIDTQTKLYLILELGDGGDLYDYIMKHEHGLDEELARHYFRQVVHAISYCHKLHVVHRDLKPENVVFFEKLNMVKLTDFGFSNRFNPGQKLETSCGSLAYSAPEILLGDSYDAPAVDIWSLGVILYMLVCGHPPFQEANDSETLTMIMDCKYTVPAHVSEGCRRLIGLMLQREPEHRATLEGIANDAWLQAGSPVTPADYLPLVSREHLSEDDHALIIQKMVNGKIATKEEILESLDKNEYNQTTATYFLLAERKLRAQRHEQAQIINQGQRLAVLTPEKPPVVKERPFLPSDKKRSMLTLTPVHIQPPATPKVDSPELPRRPRQCSIVTEEDEDALSGAGSTGRRSQRTSNSSLASSQRSSSSSLANQRVSNQNLAQSLRNRGIFNSAAVNNSVTVNPVGIPSKSMHLDLDKENRLIPAVPGAGTISEPPVPCSQKVLAAPAPFPTTSNLGLGLRSPRTSPLTSPVVTPRAVPAALYRTPSIERTSGKNTPSSLSPTSPSTPSSPGSSNSPSSLMSPPGSGSTLPLSSSSIGSNKGGGGRSLSSPNRMLHAVRSSPQLVLNEIFEEGENESESEMTDHIEGNTRNRTRVDVASSSSARPHHHRKSHWRASSLESRVSTGNTSNSTLVASTANPSPNLVRRYEQRRKMAKARTASCSSSDASDEDSDARKKRAEKWKAFPRRDSHDDSSDPGNDHNDPGNSGGAGSGQGMRHSGQQGTAGQNHAAGADSKASGSGTTTNHSNKGRSCPLAREETEEEEEDEEPDATTPVRLYTPHRRPSSAHRHRYRLRPPNLVGSDTLLRSSQSLTSLAEVCENGESPVLGAKSKPGLLQVTAKPVLQARSTGDVTNHGGGLPQASYDDLLHSPLTLVLSREPAKQRRTMVADPVFYKGNVRPLSADVSGATEGSGGSLHCNGGLLLVREDSDLTTLQGISNDLNGGTTADVTALTLKTKSLGRDAKLTVSPSPAMKTSTLDSSSSKATAASTHAGFKGTFRRLRLHKPQQTEKEPRRPVSAEEGSAWTPLSAKPVGASLGQSASFRSRLHKAKSLGSLVKERLLCEASQCQFELWRRFGVKKGGDVNGNAAAWRRTLGWSKLRHTAGGMDKESMTPLPLRTCAHGVTHVQGVGTRCSLC